MAEAKVLADRIFAAEGILADVVRVCSANILLVLCSRVAFPLPWTPVQVTGQTFGVMLVAVLLGSHRGLLTLTLYLLEGIAGLPVFAPTTASAGPSNFLGPSAGYLLAFPPAAFVTGWLVERSAAIRFLPLAGARLAGALISGEAIIFVGGCAGLATIPGIGGQHALQAGFWPFLPGEIIKMASLVAAVRGVELARRET